jgi:hypothetical protein
MLKILWRSITIMTSSYVAAKKRDDPAAISEAAEGQFADCGWVAKPTVLLDNRAQLGIALTKIINPDRGVR